MNLLVKLAVGDDLIEKLDEVPAGVTRSGTWAGILGRTSAIASRKQQVA